LSPQANRHDPPMTASDNSNGTQGQITAREREILHLISQGKNNREIAAELDISVKTAETHRTNIMRKLRLHTSNELVRYALQNNLVES